MRRTDEMKRSFTLERNGQGVAIVTIDVPGEAVNTLSDRLNRELEVVLGELDDDDGVKAVVLISGKSDGFVAGADVSMLQGVTTAQEAERLSRAAQAAFDKVEKSRFPIVAAIHGACLGGGLEWALACQYRIATDDPKTQLGLPEVMLGLLPGGGGTQRLPRLIGVQAALDLILTGKQLRARKALKLGLVDEVVPAAVLREVAEKRAAELAVGKRPERPAVGLGRLKGKPARKMVEHLLGPQVWTEAALETNPVGRSVLFKKAREQVLKKSGGHYPAPLKALEAVRVGLDEGIERGLQAEARNFGELVVSDTAHELMGLFFARTALKKDTGVEDPEVRARPVHKVGVLGAGLMGSGIAYVSLEAGHEVRLKDRDAPSVGRGLAGIRKIYDERVKRRSLGGLERESRLGRLTGATDMIGFGNADLIIEAVFEDLALKHRVLGEVEAVCTPDTIFASNTSSIPIARIAEAAKRPHNVVGMHYFSPVQKMPLLEVIAAPQSSPVAVATAVEVGKRQGKTVIVVRDGPGFYTSRVLAPYLNEAAFLLIEGVDPIALDKALVEFGFPVGPVTLLDEVGIDVAAKAGKVLHEAFGERMAAPKALGALLEDGRLGRKAKKGFYRYDAKTGEKLKEVDQSVYAVIGSRPRISMSREEMAERCALAMVNEALRCLGEGIVRSPRDGDIGAVFGLGFPPFLGGPFRWVDRHGAQALLNKLEALTATVGPRFAPAPLLVELAKENRKLYPA